MSISKNQLDLINSGLLDQLGQVNTPSLNDGDTLQNILQNVADFLTDELRESATMQNVIATKRLRSGIDPTPSKAEGSNVSVSIVMPDYWKYAEYGRRSGKRPPVKALEEWITAKGIPLKVKKGENSLMARHSLAMAISKKIGQKGTIKRFGYKGSGFVSAVMTPDNQRVIAEHVAQMAGRKIELFFSVGQK